MKNNLPEKIEVNQENYEKILEIAKISSSKTNLCNRLGWHKNGHKLHDLTMLLNENKFDVGIFKKIVGSKGNSIFNNKEKLEKVARESNSYTDIIREFAPKIAAGHYISLKKYLNKFNISVEHFNIYKNRPNNRYYNNDSIFIKNSPCHVTTIKNRILKDGLLDYKCSSMGCENRGIWLGKKLVLQLEHINGDNTDNRLENLTWLCPNCHSMTDTFCSRNKVNLKNKKSAPLIERSLFFKEIEKDKDNFFTIIVKCKSYKDILNKYGYKYSKKMHEDLSFLINENRGNKNVSKFLERHGKRELKIPYPPMSELIKMLKQQPFTKVAIELGCSDKAIVKHLERNGIDPKTVRK